MGSGIGEWRCRTAQNRYEPNEPVWTVGDPSALLKPAMNVMSSQVYWQLNTLNCKQHVCVLLLHQPNKCHLPSVELQPPRFFAHLPSPHFPSFFSPSLVYWRLPTQVWHSYASDTSIMLMTNSISRAPGMSPLQDSLSLALIKPTEVSCSTSSSSIDALRDRSPSEPQEAQELRCCRDFHPDKVSLLPWYRSSSVRMIGTVPKSSFNIAIPLRTTGDWPSKSSCTSDIWGSPASQACVSYFNTRCGWWD